MARENAIEQGDRVEVEYQTAPVTTSEQAGMVTEKDTDEVVVDTDSDLIGSLRINFASDSVNEVEADDAVFELVTVTKQ